MDVDESSWKTREAWDLGRWKCFDGACYRAFEEQVLDSTIEGSGSQASASAYLNDNFDANDHGMDDLDLMFEQIMPDASSISSSVPMLPVQADTSADFGSEDLPPGWQAAVDPKTGMTYYANINTGESSGTSPHGMTSFLQSYPLLRDLRQIMCRRSNQGSAFLNHAEGQVVLIGVIESKLWPQDEKGGNGHRRKMPIY